MGEIQATIAARPATKTIEENGHLRESQAVGLHESKVGRDEGRRKQGKVASERQEKSSLSRMSYSTRTGTSSQGQEIGP